VRPWRRKRPWVHNGQPLWAQYSSVHHCIFLALSYSHSLILARSLSVCLSGSPSRARARNHALRRPGPGRQGRHLRDAKELQRPARPILIVRRREHGPCDIFCLPLRIDRDLVFGWRGRRVSTRLPLKRKALLAHTRHACAEGSRSQARQGARWLPESLGANAREVVGAGAFWSTATPLEKYLTRRVSKARGLHSSGRARR